MWVIVDFLGFVCVIVFVFVSVGVRAVVMFVGVGMALVLVGEIFSVRYRSLRRTYSEGHPIPGLRELIGAQRQQDGNGQENRRQPPRPITQYPS